MSHPLLLLDIDGVISLFGFDVLKPPTGRYHLVDGVVHFLSTTVPGFLHELAGCYELVWCSGWEEKADEVLPAALGLPRGLATLLVRTDPSVGLIAEQAADLAAWAAGLRG